MKKISAGVLFICLILIIACLSVSAGQIGYDEKYRPQLHFTPKANWMNDPNGLIYNAHTGEYHMYFQYCDTLAEDQSKKSWGHAVSKDLVHWTEKAVAITPDELGSIWSGSAVIDRKNTSGFFKDDVPAENRMVAFFTYAGGDTSYGYEKQGMAYSSDGGYTWTKYEGNPILATVEDGKEVYGGGFRDPCVLWYEDPSYSAGGIWLMVTAGGDARLFTSENMKDWTYNTTLLQKNGNKINSECPDFYPAPVYDSDGNATSETKWVYSGAGRFYVVGTLVKDAQGVFSYTAETGEKSYLCSSTEMYAAQTFTDAPNGRRIAIYWLIDLYSKQMEASENKIWDGVQSLPIELKLYKTENSYEMTANPVEELDKLRKTEIYSAENLTIKDGDENIFKDIQGDMLEIELVCSLEASSKMLLSLRSDGEEEETVVRYTAATKSLILSRGKSGSVKGENYTIKVGGDKVKLHIFVDRSVVDVFVNDGEYSLNGHIFPKPESKNLEMNINGVSAEFEYIKVYELSSIWEGNDVIEPTQKPESESQDKSSTSTTLLIVIICLFVILLGVVVFLLLGSKKKKQA